MIRSSRHDEAARREEDGAVRFDDLATIFRSEFDGTSHWSTRAWISFLAEGGGHKKRFQYCLEPSLVWTLLVFPSNSRTFRRHSRWSCIAKRNYVLLPDDFVEYIYHTGNDHDMHTISQCALIPGGKTLKRDRHSVFFAAVNPMYTNQHQGEVQYDLDKPRIAEYQNT